MAELSYPRLENGRVIYAPDSQPKPQITITPGIVVEDSQFGVNINAADLEALILAGLTRPQAERILVYRDAHGPFPSVDALTEVPRIGEKILAAVRDRVTV